MHTICVLLYAVLPASDANLHKAHERRRRITLT